jgi:hypothetical protein
MNKKIFVIVSVLTVAMLSGSIVGVFAAKKTTTTYLLAATFSEPQQEILWSNPIPRGQGFPPEKPFSKQLENVDMVTLNIGGSLEEIAPGAGVYVMVGGTTYVLGEDFTYEAFRLLKGENVNPDAVSPADFVWSHIDISVWTTITFLPGSGIDGTIQYQLRIEYMFEPPGTFAGFTLRLKGHGTGDLKGAIFNAEGGPLIMHGAGLVTAATHEGTVTGWPT